jgi:hypothetical protein
LTAFCIPLPYALRFPVIGRIDPIWMGPPCRAPADADSPVNPATPATVAPFTYSRRVVRYFSDISDVEHDAILINNCVCLSANTSIVQAHSASDDRKSASAGDSSVRSDETSSAEK